jgi:hypothetical protein
MESSESASPENSVSTDEIVTQRIRYWFSVERDSAGPADLLIILNAQRVDVSLDTIAILKFCDIEGLHKDV